MLKGLFSKMFGTHSQRELKTIEPLINQIESLGESYRALTDEQLSAKTAEFKQALADGKTLDDILPDAFAAVREACDRVLGMRPYRVQLIGGIVLHQGRIAEMKTGEGKTLVAVLPAYLNALAGKGVHIVTVNDYLARRDSEWMGRVHRFMGLTVGLIVHGLTPEERKAAYASDITYGTNNEMGFDYLRDNMAIYKNNMVQRGHSFAIVDEVDSILIDEARTPLIISGQGDESTDLYRQVDEFVRRLKKQVYATTDEKQEEDESLDADYIVDEKAHSATLTARGIAKAEAHFSLENLADLENTTLTHHINQALKAYGLMHRDVDYVVKDGEVIIVDEFTGRLMYGRRYSEGLHQAIEAKENVKVEKESKTLATITFQNYFRLYDKLSGMTGTALTEEEEFGTIYKLDIIEIPTNEPVIRIDHPDVVYKNETGKNRAILRQIAECHEKGQPVLVGTISIEKSENLAKLLKREGITANVLNAKHHEQEAAIVAQAGRFGAVTIATNMAGRGTDIMLGGNPDFMARQELLKEGFDEELVAEVVGGAPGAVTEEDEAAVQVKPGALSEEQTHDPEVARARYRALREKFKEQTDEEKLRVKEAGGLFIVGTERHESRRIDNQLRGRSGRQGDPGETRFYLALTDDIMRLFGSDRVMGIMDSLKLDDDTPIDQKILSNAIESAQKRVESRNFQMRKNVLEYDDVMNLQREKIYEQRRMVLDGENIKQYVQSMIHGVIEREINSAYTGEHEDNSEILRPFGELFLTPDDMNLALHMEKQELLDFTLEKAEDAYEKKEAELGLVEGTDMPLMRELERVIMLRVVDEYWMDHIDAMQDLRQGVYLRAYGQVNPLDEYKQEGFDMFEAMVNGIREEVVRRIFTARVTKRQPLQRKSVTRNVEAASNVGGDDSVKRGPVKVGKKIGRNDPCPCGKKRPNGLPMKYKDCCGKYE